MGALSLKSWQQQLDRHPPLPLYFDSCDLLYIRGTHTGGHTACKCRRQAGPTLLTCTQRTQRASGRTHPVRQERPAAAGWVPAISVVRVHGEMTHEARCAQIFATTRSWAAGRRILSALPRGAMARHGGAGAAEHGPETCGTACACLALTARRCHSRHARHTVTTLHHTGSVLMFHHTLLVT